MLVRMGNRYIVLDFDRIRELRLSDADSEDGDSDSPARPELSIYWLDDRGTAAGSSRLDGSQEEVDTIRRMLDSLVDAGKKLVDLSDATGDKERAPSTRRHARPSGGLQ